MLASSKRQAARAAEIPADLDAAQNFDDWRDRVWWPVSIGEANRISAAQAQRALAFAAGLEDDLARDAALLAMPTILGYGRAIVLAALAASRARAKGYRFIGSAPEFLFLETGKGHPPPRVNPTLPPQAIRSHFLRRVARIHSWSGLTGLFLGLFRSDATAISHNHLLCAAAEATRKRIGFWHADVILQAAQLDNRSNSSMGRDHAATLASTILGNAINKEPYRSRAKELLERTAAPHLARAAADMVALRYARLPDTIWSGSGGLYAPRAIGLEVLRRSGNVIRFDHGTPKGFVRAVEANNLVEFAVSSQFVVATEEAARICRDSRDKEVPGARSAIIRGAEGDPTFAGVPSRRGSRNGRKLRVVYAPTQLLGFRELLPLQPPDIVHLNWQLVVAEALKGMEIEPICQPHPEGLFRGRPHPLEAVAPTSRGNFEAQLSAADVFVFDYPSTTALWQAAACSDAHIVFLDLGAGEFSPPVARLISERARTIRVAYDERNRPILDAHELRDAVLTEKPADPLPLRRLLAGV